MRGLRDRYAEISRRLREARLPFMMGLTYLGPGTRVGGDWYPVLKMPWVVGLLLNQFVRVNADRPALLEALSQLWVRVARRPPHPAVFAPTARYCSAPATSPPAAVASARYVARLMPSPTSRTEPSHRAKLAPPEWKERKPKLTHHWSGAPRR